MNRFIPVSLALFLGLISASELATPQDQLFLVDVDVSDAQKASCYFYDDLTFFDLTSLSTTDALVIGNYQVSFCKPASVADPANTTNSIYYFAYNSKDNLVYADSTLTSTSVEAVADDDGVRHIKFVKDSDTVCSSDSTKTLTTTYEVLCDEDKTADITSADVTVDSSDLCNIKVTLSHSSGCAVFQATAVVEYLTANPWAMGIILIAFGFLATFFGGKFVDVVLGGVTGGLTFLILILLASLIGLLDALDTLATVSTFEIVLAVFVFIGALAAAFSVGWFIIRVRRVGVTVLAGAGGCFFGITLYNLVFAQWASEVWVLILVVGLSLGIAAYMAWTYQNAVIVYVTAFLGSYALVRGVSVFIDKFPFPNEITMIQELITGTFTLDT